MAYFTLMVYFGILWQNAANTYDINKKVPSICSLISFNVVTCDNLEQSRIQIPILY